MLYLKWIIAAYILSQGSLITFAATRNKLTPGTRLILSGVFFLHVIAAGIIVWLA